MVSTALTNQTKILLPKNIMLDQDSITVEFNKPRLISTRVSPWPLSS
jgi:hypothetical protein